MLFEGFPSSVCKILFLYFFLFPSNVPHNLNNILKSVSQTEEKRGEILLGVPLPPQQGSRCPDFLNGIE